VELPPPGKPPRIALIGLASWDLLLVTGQFPVAGSYAIAEQALALPGGTTANTATALARLGANVELAAMIGDDPEGAAVAESLRAEGVGLRWLAKRDGEPTDRSYVIVSGDPPDRTIIWQQGARLALGDRLDIPALFAHDLVVIDVDDMRLRRFLADLPVHTLPGTRLAGTLSYLVDYDRADVLETLLRLDFAIGNERELKWITGQTDLETAVAAMQATMVGNNLRACAISLGGQGAIAFTATERWQAPAFEVEIVDATGAGDAFAAGVAYGSALRWGWPETLRFANAVAGLAVTGLGAQTALPNLDAVRALLERG
jgi:ribokinase